MNRTWFKLAVVLTAFFAVSCTRNQEIVEVLPGISVKSSNINTQVQLVDAPQLQNSHKNGDLLSLQIINLTNKTIDFANDFGLKMLMQTGQNWSNVENNAYNGPNVNNLLPQSSDPSGLIVDTSPYIPNMSSPAKIRVAVVGHVEGNDRELVAAFLDVVINP